MKISPAMQPLFPRSGSPRFAGKGLPVFRVAGNSPAAARNRKEAKFAPAPLGRSMDRKRASAYLSPYLSPGVERG